MILSLTLAAGDVNTLAIDLLKVLACASAVALALGKLKISVIPGYLLAGALIGPSAIGLVDSKDAVDEIASLAVVVLMFGIGLHLDAAQFRRGIGRLILVGVGSTLVSSLVLWLAAMVLGMGWREALVAGMAMSLSSTAVVMRLLQERRETSRAHGRLSLGILIMQDLVVIAMLTVLPLLAMPEAVEPAVLDPAVLDPGVESVAAEGEEAGMTDLLFGGVLGFCLRCLLVGALVVLGKIFLPGLLREAQRASSGEVLLVLSFAIALGASAGAGFLFLSPELGAFVAGFLLSGTSFKYQLSGQVAPLRDLFMAVFFTAVGLSLDVEALASSWYVVLIGAGIVLVVKALVIAGGAWAVGASGPVAVRTGVMLAQAGEFSLVLLGVASVEFGIIDDDAFAQLAGIVAITLIVTPALGALGARLANAATELRPPPWVGGDTIEEASSIGGETVGPRAIVAGFGPVGRTVADSLTRRGFSVTIIEMNAETVRTQQRIGKRVVYGDIRNPEVLHSAGVAEADAIVLTVPDEEATLVACRTIRAASPEIFIAVRANVVSKGLLAKGLGADHVTVEEIATAQAMADQVVLQLDIRGSLQSGELSID